MLWPLSRGGGLKALVAGPLRKELLRLPSGGKERYSVKETERYKESDRDTRKQKYRKKVIKSLNNFSHTLCMSEQ